MNLGRCNSCGAANTEAFPDGSKKARCMVCGELVVSPIDKNRLSKRLKSASKKATSNNRRSARIKSGRQFVKTESTTAHISTRVAAINIPTEDTGIVEVPDFSPTKQVLAGFQRRGWPCQVWEGFDSFAVEARMPRDDGAPMDLFNITVTTVGEVMIFETLLMPLPKPPWLAFREVLNELNLRSNGSICLIRKCGVVLSYRLILRPSEKEVPQERIFQVLRRLNHDRQLALPILEEVGRTGVSQLSRIRRTLSIPSAAYSGPPVRFHDLQMLINFSGYHSCQEGQVLYLSEDPRPAKRCPVRLGLVGGAIRAWTLPGKDPASQRWSAMNRLLKSFKKETGKFRWKQYSQILKILSEMNENSTLLRYSWNDFKILAMASYVPFEGKLDGGEFRSHMEELFTCAREGMTQTMIIQKAT